MFMIFVSLGLWIIHFETPLSPEKMKRKMSMSLSNISFNVPLPCMQISHHITEIASNILKWQVSHLQAFSAKMNNYY